MRTSKSIFRVLKITLLHTGHICTSSLVAVLLLLLIPSVLGARAAVVFTSLYSFTGTNDGGGPGGLVQCSDGHFYGTTRVGGTNGGSGTVFKISSNGVLTSLYSFTGGNDGAFPNGLVQSSDGCFYGTTYWGGTTNYNPDWDNYGNGTVFKISTKGALKNLYSFTGGDDGEGPYSALVQGSDGYFYGTTRRGDTNYYSGTVFKINTNGALTSLCYFTNGGGILPSGLAQGKDGYFYGTTEMDAYLFQRKWGYGSVFQISADGAYTNLYRFTGTNDGAYPFGGLVLGSDGYLYGTTRLGGTNNMGTVFRISTNGSLATLYSFGSVRDTNGFVLDGYSPSAALVQGNDGSFYGTTANGGQAEAGTIFRLTIVPAPPQLAIIHSAGKVVLAWPTNAIGFTLQSTATLGSSAGWATNSPAPFVVNGQNLVTNPITGTQQYFRLSR